MPGKPYAMRVLRRMAAGEAERFAVESEAPRRVLVTPLRGSTRTTYATGSASRG